MKKFIFYFMLLPAYLTHTNFITNSILQYRSNREFEKKNFQQAQQDYTKLLEKKPYDPVTNYNLGLTFFQQKNLTKALDYFTRSASQAITNSLLQEQSLFNQGNTFVGLEKLQDAIESYEKALTINPNNERTQHNLEIVKKMLQEKQQQKQEQDNNPNKSNNQKDKNKKNKSSDQNQQPDDQDSQEQQQDKSTQDQQSQNTNSEKLDDQNQQSDKQHDQQEKDNKKRNQQEKQPEQNQTKEQNAEQLEKSKQQEKEQSDSLQKSSEKQNQSSDSENKDQEPQEKGSLQDNLAQEMLSNSADDKRLNTQSAMLMQKMKDQEDHIQKQLLKMNVSKQGATKHGQKNW